MTGRLFTLRAVARELGLPESTVRYYRDAFADVLPTSGEGRRRRHPAAALPCFRLIAEGFAANLTRDEIRSDLVALQDGAAPAVEPPDRRPVVIAPLVPHAQESPQELVALILDGERERREVMWQMAREIVRLGEAIERQHAVLSELVRQVERQATAQLLPAPDPDAPDGARMTGELDALRAELARERELVDRLRRSKLEIERRAAEAEAALGDADPGGRLRRAFGVNRPGARPG
ncbi:MAG: helix-turn-helix domain-containing protein [Gemmatimonadota bacterium]|nr:helix-turn-helix domain-containing protein [Gemmatimonadota bacterium]